MKMDRLLILKPTMKIGLYTTGKTTTKKKPFGCMVITPYFKEKISIGYTKTLYQTTHQKLI